MGRRHVGSLGAETLISCDELKPQQHRRHSELARLCATVQFASLGRRIPYVLVRKLANFAFFHTTCGFDI